MTPVGRPRTYDDHVDYMTFDRHCGKYVVRNPISKKKRKFDDKDKAIEAARLLKEWVETERQAQALDAGKPTISGLVDAWKRDKLQFQPWDKGTRKNNLTKMERIKRELGHRQVARTDVMFLDEWLCTFCRKADTYNKWRYVFLLLWRYAVAKNMATANEGEKLEFRSTSSKVEMNRKERSALTLDQFWAIHAKAAPWLQIAMEQSLVTLQARQEICNMRHTDYRDGFLYVIRDKTSGDSDMAFIKIELTPQLKEIRERSKDDYVSPYLVHRAPDMRHRKELDSKPHWTYILPDYLTKAFAAARDATGLFEHMKPRERPTFHEIRGLGSRLYRDMGVPEADIQALMTHAHKRTTQIYLEHGAKALTDDDYHPVRASMVLSAIRQKQ